LKSIFKYSIVFLIGLVIGFSYLWQTKKITQKKQIDIITNGVKNVSKLVVTEATFSEIYNYEEETNYFFDAFGFAKKVILLVNAKVQVSYDLKKLEIEIDSLNKKIFIKHIPKEEITISPSFKYYDLQQSMWNTFTKDNLNTIQQNSIDKLIGTVEISSVKENAKKQLFLELNNLYNLAQLFDWELIDQTKSEEHIVKFPFKD
jgi:hypothetical protein